MSRSGSAERPAAAEFEEETYVDVRKLPLKPPQPLPTPEKPARRPWHPVMWDNSIIGQPLPNDTVDETSAASQQGEYPHKQRLRNLKRLVEEGKVKPTPEMIIFFLCNKFAVSEDRKGKVA